MVENVTNAVETTENIVVNYRKGYKYIFIQKISSTLPKQNSHILKRVGHHVWNLKKVKLLLAYYQSSCCFYYYH